jgi:hypothetical protein
VASFSVTYNSRAWLPVPREFPTDDGETADAWAARNAAERRERGFTESERSGTLEDYFGRILAAAQKNPVDHDTIWALVPDEAPGFLMAACDTREAEGSIDDFLAALAGRRDNQYEPAKVTHLDQPNLGQGVRIVRHDFDERRELYVSVYYVFRTQGVDVMVSTQSYDLAMTDWSLPLLDELVDGVTITGGAA